MYNRNVFTHTYLLKEFIGRSNGAADSTILRRAQYRLKQIHPKLAPPNLRFANVCAKPKISNFNPVTDGYTRP